MKRLAAIALLALVPIGAVAADGPVADKQPAAKHVTVPQAVANDASFGDWRVVCRAITTTSNECRLVQTLSRTKDKSLVVRLIAVPEKDGGAVLVAQVPIGAFLPAQPVVKPAEPKNAKSQAFVWQRCLNGICEAARKITGKEVSDLTAAGTVLFGYKMQANGNPIVVKISMEKFGEGLAAIEATATQ